MIRSLVICTAILMLSGCSSPLLDDAALGTIRVPNENECQWRRFEGAGGGGAGASISGSLKMVTVAGPEHCSTPTKMKAAGELLR
jgi:hypothetical protein